jgi:hypothetical protein
MNYPHYDIQESISRLHFEFVSQGPKGHIRKVVDYSYIEELGVWNLGFGDYNAITRSIDDQIVTDNGDGRKVLATVIFTLNEFFIGHPEAIVFFTGSTERRTELYGRIIQQNIRDFSNRFLVEGVNQDGSTEAFNRSKSYFAYLISLLNSNNNEIA